MSKDIRLQISRVYTHHQNKTYITTTTNKRNPQITTYEFKLEDSTIGNLMTHHLMKTKGVKYAGFKVEHPLVDVMQLKLETVEGKGNAEAMKEASFELQKKLIFMEDSFWEAVGRFRKDFE